MKSQFDSCFVVKKHDQHTTDPGGKRRLLHDNTAFGWKAMVDVYDGDIARARQGLAREVRGLQKSYITRDSWTKLNVRPAKIMVVSG